MTLSINFERFSMKRKLHNLWHALRGKRSAMFITLNRCFPIIRIAEHEDDHWEKVCRAFSHKRFSQINFIQLTFFAQSEYHEIKKYCKTHNISLFSIISLDTYGGWEATSAFRWKQFQVFTSKYSWWTFCVVLYEKQSVWRVIEDAFLSQSVLDEHHVSNVH